MLGYDHHFSRPIYIYIYNIYYVKHPWFLLPVRIFLMGNLHENHGLRVHRYLGDQGVRNLDSVNHLGRPNR